MNVLFHTLTGYNTEQADVVVVFLTLYYIHVNKHKECLTPDFKSWHGYSLPNSNSLYSQVTITTLFKKKSALCAYNLYNKLKTKQQQQSAWWHTRLDRWSQWYIIVTWFLFLSFWGLSGLNSTLSSSAQNTPSENHLSFELCKKSNLLIPTQWQKKI